MTETTLQVSPTPTVNVRDLEKASTPTASTPKLSNARRWSLLALLSTAQFLDIFASSAVVLALGKIAEAVGMTPSEANWIVNSYALVLASTLLTGGRLADMWSAKWIFILGFFCLGATNLGLGFVKNKAGFLILRALSGLGASLTIPAATNIIVVSLFPEPKEQEIALGLFGGSAAFANIIGLVIGGGLLASGDYKWIFFFIAIICLPLSVLSIFVIPKSEVPVVVVENGVPRKPRFDYLGTFFQIASIALFVYALTEANVRGWKTAGSIATLIIGLALFVVFFLVENRAGELDALIRPSLWKIPNVTVSVIYTMSLLYWFFASQVPYATVFEVLWGQSPIMTAVRFLPSSICGVAAMIIGQAIPTTKIPIKTRLVLGSLIAGGSNILFAYGYDQSSYWKIIFIGLIFGSAGNSFAFISIYVNFIQSVPAEVSGVTGAILQSSAQLGIAFFLSIQSTIQIAYPASPELGYASLPSRKGYKYGFVFSACVCFAAMLLVLAFFKEPEPRSSVVEEEREEVEGARVVEGKREGVSAVERS